MEKIASRYALALFELAVEKDCVDEWQNEMKALVEIFQQSNDFVHFLEHRKISSEEKKRFLQQLFEGKIHPDVYNFLRLLIDKGRIRHFTEIAKTFHSLCNERKGIEEGIVYSMFPLSKQELQSIEEAVSQRFTKKIELMNRIEPTLISGVRVVVGDQVLDGSMKNKIETLRVAMLKESR